MATGMGCVETRSQLPSGARPAPPTRDEIEAICREIVADTLDHLGIDSDTFVGRERVRANLAFLQSIREQHADRGREFRRGLFQNTGNLVALAGMSAILLAGGYLVGHGFSFR